MHKIKKNRRNPIFFTIKGKFGVIDGEVLRLLTENRGFYIGVR